MNSKKQPHAFCVCLLSCCDPSSVLPVKFAAGDLAKCTWLDPFADGRTVAAFSPAAQLQESHLSYVSL